ncbi:MAG: HAMP domain-containing histidine kinase [Gemmatales bacterium]|nr:HAMP domain-containing histidine kinase [Gemmatales bacterium]MDW8386508.1 HAMP domain-containing sensor histidine kinase [Gemmatales bacterium]
MRWPIQVQVLVPVAAWLLGVVGLGTWMAYAAAQRAIRQQVENQVHNMAVVLGDVPFPLTPTVLQQVKGLSGTEIVLIGTDGRIHSTLPSIPGDMPLVASSDAETKTFRLSDPILVHEETYLMGGVQLRTSAGERAGTLIILYPYSRWQQALQEAVRPVLLIGAAGGVLAIVLAVLIAARLSSRVRDLQRRTRMIAAGDFSPMPLPLWNDELRDLAADVNLMAEHLARLQDAVKRTERLRLLGQLGGGLAHQLRNGIAGARLAVQVHLREHPDLDNEPLEVALRQLSLVENNLHRFLDLGRAESEAKQRVSLPDLIQEAVDLLKPQARHHQVDLTFHLAPNDDSSSASASGGRQAPGPSNTASASNITASGGRQAPGPTADNYTLDAHPTSLSHLFLNLVQNAIEAAGHGGSVEIVLRQEDGRYVVEVFDTGPGPDPAIADRLFEPFITAKPEGIGLGLAVARQAAEAHGGTLTWHRSGQRTCFRFTLPVASNNGPRDHQADACRTAPSS